MIHGLLSRRAKNSRRPSSDGGNAPAWLTCHFTTSWPYTVSMIVAKISGGPTTSTVLQDRVADPREAVPVSVVEHDPLSSDIDDHRVGEHLGVPAGRSRLQPRLGVTAYPLDSI